MGEMAGIQVQNSIVALMRGKPVQGELDPRARLNTSKHKSWGKILHVYRYLLVGGVEFYVLQMARALPEYEHVLFICSKTGNGEMVKTLAEYGIRVRFLYGDKYHLTEDMVKEIKPQVIVWHDSSWPMGLPDKKTRKDILWVRVSHSIIPNLKETRAHFQVCVSKQAWNFLHSEVRDRVRVCGVGVDISDYMRKKRVPEEFVVGRFGSDRVEKYDPGTVEIYKGVEAEGVSYLIVGGMVHKKKMEELGLADKTTWIIPNTWAKYLVISKFDTVVYRNARRCVESFGIAVLELMAAGVPIVVENRGGLRDMVENERSGFLVDWEDKVGFIDRVNWLRENCKEAEEMGKMAMEKVRMEYSLQVMREAWLAILGG